MICPYCGKENPEGLDIYNFYGALLTASEKPTTASNPPEVSSQEMVQNLAEACEPLAETHPAPNSPREIRLPANYTPVSPGGGLVGNRVRWLVGGLFFYEDIFVVQSYQVVRS